MTVLIEKNKELDVQIKRFIILYASSPWFYFYNTFNNTFGFCFNILKHWVRENFKQHLIKAC